MWGVVLLGMVSTKGLCVDGDVAEAVGALGGCTLTPQGCFSSGGFNTSRYASNESCKWHMCRALFLKAPM